MRMLRDLIVHSGLSSPGVQSEKFYCLNTRLSPHAIVIRSVDLRRHFHLARRNRLAAVCLSLIDKHYDSKQRSLTSTQQTWPQMTLKAQDEDSVLELICGRVSRIRFGTGLLMGGSGNNSPTDCSVNECLKCSIAKTLHVRQEDQRKWTNTSVLSSCFCAHTHTHTDSYTHIQIRVTINNIIKMNIDKNNHYFNMTLVTLVYLWVCSV